MFYDVYSLENELNNGMFESETIQLNAIKVLEALRFMVKSHKDLDMKVMSIQTELYNAQSEISTLHSKMDDYEYLFKKISKDYPEVVLSKPHLFEDETK